MTPPDDEYLLPEQRARKRIDEMLVRAGWVVQDYKSINLYASAGVAVRELVTTAGRRTTCSSSIAKRSV